MMSTLSSPVVVFQFQKHVEFFHEVFEREQYGLAFSILFGTSFMLLKHQYPSLASSSHPTSVANLEFKKICAIFYSSNVSCIRWNPSTIYENMIERHLQKNAWSNTAPPSKRHREPAHKFNWRQRAKAPFALLLRVHNWRYLQIAPTGSVLNQTQSVPSVC